MSSPLINTRFSALSLLFFASAAQAQLPSTEWSPPNQSYEFKAEHHDATYTELAQKTLIDWSYVNQEAPSSHGLEWGVLGEAGVQVRRNYVYIEDKNNSFNTPFSQMSDFSNAFDFATRELYSVVPQEHVLIYLFTSFETGVGAFFYQHQANEVRGIGLPMFDNNGPSNPLQGFIFMNYWKAFEQLYGQAGPDVVRGFSRHTFNQETGHRWVVSFDRDGNGDAKLGALLGRDQAHWSYFMNSEGSPMEGNWWLDNGNNTFTTRTNYNNWYYNNLDLYLMGMVAVADVEPWWLITDVDTRGAMDLTRNSPSATSPPQILFPQTIGGTRVDYDITDVTTKFGARYPPRGQAPTTFKSIFVMLATNRNPLSETQRLEFEEMVDDYVEGFVAGSGNRASLDYALTADIGLPIGTVCTEVDECNPAESNVCAQPSGAPATICSRLCASQSGCPTDWCCQAGVNGQNMCTPSALCNTGQADAGTPNSSGDAGSSAADSDAATPPCLCDIDTACTEGCACDIECFSRTDCSCDLTDICDQGCERCDPECLFEDSSDGCSGCVTVGNGSPQATLLFLLGLVLAFRRNRRARNRNKSLVP